VAVRTVKVWNAATSEWEGIGIEMPDVPASTDPGLNPFLLMGA
jgi:hypothetical protein